MKKVLLILALSMGVMFSSTAQISTSALKNAASKVTEKAKVTGLDVNSLSSGVMSKLTSALALTSAQKPKVLEAVTNFFQQKSSILDLAKTNKTEYASKLGGLTTGLQSKLKTVLTVAQFSKFLNLKPQTNTPTNVMSQLFY